MFRKLGLACAALAFFSIAGGHWAVLQTVAWAEMVSDYAQRNGSIAVAVEHTFDGRHPCNLCRDIAAAKGKEHRENSPAPGLKDCTGVKALPLVSLPASGERVATEFCFSGAVSLHQPDRADSPPTPPPRWRAVNPA